MAMQLLGRLALACVLCRCASFAPPPRRASCVRPRPELRAMSEEMIIETQKLVNAEEFDRTVDSLMRAKPGTSRSEAESEYAKYLLDPEARARVLFPPPRPRR